jgi:hypothetical protein
MDGVIVETVLRQGSYDIVASTVISESDLQTPTVFSCELHTPEAQYSVSKSLVYYPGKGHRPLHFTFHILLLHVNIASQKPSKYDIHTYLNHLLIIKPEIVSIYKL